MPATEEHAEAIAAFLRQTWDPDATAASVRASMDRARRNRVLPGSPYPTYVALVGDAVGGYLSSLPARFWLAGQEVPGWWAKGLMVLPDFRNGPLGALLVREQAKQLPVLGSLAVNPPAIRLFTASGLAEVGPVPNRLCLLAPQRVVTQLDVAAVPLEGLPRIVRLGGRLLRFAPIRLAAAAAAFGAGAVLRAWRRLAAPRGYEARVVSRVPDDAESLWANVRERIRAGIVRDAAHFEDRLHGRDSGRYALFEVRERGRLAGIGMVRLPRETGDPRLGNLRVAVLSDALFDPARPRDGRALFAAAERVGERASADAVVLSTTHGLLNLIGVRRGYIRLPPNVRYLVRLPADALPPLEEWWLMRSDGGGDDAF